MENTTSNAPVRRSATRKAVFLTLIPMLFAGMAGGLFSPARYWEEDKMINDGNTNLNELVSLQKNVEELLKQLDSIDSTWEEVIVLNEQWENANAATTKSSKERKIRELEAQIQDGIRMIQKSNFGAIGEKAAYAHQLLLESRKAIWQLRLEKPIVALPTDSNADQCEKDLQKIRDKANSLANTVDLNLVNIENASAEIRKFLHSKRHQEVQRKIERSVEDIKNISNRLRDL